MFTDILSVILRLMLPRATDLRLETISADDHTKRLTLVLTSTQPFPTCPLCQTPAPRLHSTYTRTLADLPWADVAVTLQVQVRKCFCARPTCPRKIFAEHITPRAAPWARRTTRLATAQQRIGLALGGAAGARLAHDLHMPAGLDLLLVLVRRAPLPPSPVPHALGVDEWARRKGQTYGTIIVNLETGEPLEVLPERSPESLAQWLRAHPEVEIIGRDRAGVYAEGARQGAPQAIQVADRWHILQNVGELLLRVFQAHQPAIEQLLASPDASQTGPADVIAPDAPAAEVPPPDGAEPARLTRAERERQARRAARQARYDTIQQLHHQGWSIHAIAKHLGLERKTVRKYLRAPSCPEPQPRGGRQSLLDPYKGYLLERWNAGCHNAAQLFREIQQHGFHGQRSIVRDFVRQLRQAHGVPSRQRQGDGTGGSVGSAARRPSLRTLTWRVLAPPGRLDEQEQAQIVQLRQVHPELEIAITLAQEFAVMVRERGAAQLESWLTRASSSGIAALRNFAASVRQDEAAVRAALSLNWSNGPTEGNINRLKMLKRQMYGRAHVDLLRQRVLAA